MATLAIPRPFQFAVSFSAKGRAQQALRNNGPEDVQDMEAARCSATSTCGEVADRLGLSRNRTTSRSRHTTARLDVQPTCRSIFRNRRQRWSYQWRTEWCRLGALLH